MIVEKAFAKINMTLSVGKKRPDGYHDIDSVMHGISLCDTVKLKPASGIALTITEGMAPGGKANLMWEAAELFFDETGLSGGVHMELTKQIPSEAGLGGGSSDAAAVLRGLNRMTGNRLSMEKLAQMGAKLGADVPFCVVGGCCRCQGIGERMTPIEGWNGLPLVIVKPHVSVSTGKAYFLLDALEKKPEDTTEACMDALKKKDREALTQSFSNDFEAGLFGTEPVLKETSQFLKLLNPSALMTGSGSSFFMVAENEKEQKEYINQITSVYPEWYVGEAETVYENEWGKDIKQ